MPDRLERVHDEKVREAIEMLWEAHDLVPDQDRYCPQCDIAATAMRLQTWLDEGRP